VVHKIYYDFFGFIVSAEEIMYLSASACLFVVRNTQKLLDRFSQKSVK